MPAAPTSPHRPAPALRPSFAATLGGMALALLVLVGVVVTTLSSPASARLLGTTFDPAAVVAEPVRPPQTQTESGPVLDDEALARAIGQAAVDAGETKLGRPYVYSAAGPDAFDCSGFTRWAWAQMGVDLPHYTGAQWAMVEHIAISDLRAGDLVFDWSGGGDPSHVSLYVGDGMMIHAPNSSGVVRYDHIGWWTGATIAAGRVR